jgi:hypothetical protein
MDVLLETYSYIPFNRRIDVIYALLLEIFTYATQNATTIKSIVDRAEAETIAKGRAPSPFDLVGINYGVAHPGPGGQLSMTYPASAFPDPVSIESWDRATLKSRRLEKGKRAKYSALFYGRFAPTRLVRRPFAYVVPENLVGRLQNHNIRVERLSKPLTTPVEKYTVLEIKTTQRTSGPTRSWSASSGPGANPPRRPFRRERRSSPWPSRRPMSPSISWNRRATTGSRAGDCWESSPPWARNSPWPASTALRDSLPTNPDASRS